MTAVKDLTDDELIARIVASIAGTRYLSKGPRGEVAELVRRYRDHLTPRSKGGEDVPTNVSVRLLDAVKVSAREGVEGTEVSYLPWYPRGGAEGGDDGTRKGDRVQQRTADP
jgi:hypothetical protein